MPAEFGPEGRAVLAVDVGVCGRGTDDGSGDLGVAAMILARLARGELGREGGRCVDAGELGGGVFGIIIMSVIGSQLEGAVRCGSDAWNDALKLKIIYIHMYPYTGDSPDKKILCPSYKRSSPPR